jgi:stress response protein SCP2
MDKHIIVGVHIADRKKHAAQVQQIFTQYGEQIRTRLGLHDDVCSANGLILLEMEDAPESLKMIAALQAIDGMDIEQMVFCH